MKRRRWFLGKWGKNALGLTLLAVSHGLGAPDARGAESTWSGGDSVVVGAGDTVRVALDNYTNVNSIQVPAGGTLIISEGSAMGIGFDKSAEFANDGLLKIEGSLTFGGEEIAIRGNGKIEIANPTGNDNMLHLGGAHFLQMLEQQENFVVGRDASEVGREHGSNLQISGGAPGEQNFVKIDLKANQFVSGNLDTQPPATILMKDWGFVRTGNNSVTITGDELRFGTKQFSKDLFENEAVNQDIADSPMSRLRGRDITILPENGDAVTLKAGTLHIGAGADPQKPASEEKSQLTIGKDGKGTLHVDGGALLLGGGGNVAGDVQVTGNVIVGTEKEEVDSALIAKTGNWHMTGDLTLNKSGYLEVGRSYYLETYDEWVESTLSVENFIMNEDARYVVKENSFIARNGILATPTSRIDVDNGVLLLRNVTMNGGQINFDPPFIAAGDTSNASMGGLEFASSNVDGRINVGRNSMVTLGSADPEWLRTQIGEYQTKTGNLWGKDITAALAVRSPQTLAPNGALNVDGSWTSGGAPATANKAIFAANSLFVVDGAGVGKAAALDGNGTATLEVKPGAKLFVTDGAVGDSIIITDNFAASDVSEEGWAANTTSPLLEAKSGLDGQGRFVVGLAAGENPAIAFPLLVSELDAVLDAARRQGLDTDSDSAGVRFISRAVDNRFLGAKDADLAAVTIESAARMAVVGAVPQMTLAANNAAGAAITQRTSMAQPGEIIRSVDASGNYIMESKERFARQFALWVMPLYQSTNGFGLEAGNLNYDFSDALGGVALGGDYTFENMLRVGLAFNIGGGYARGGGDMNTTKNNMSFWGLGAYAGWSMDNFGLSADINYTSTYNRLKQDLPEQMRMKELKSDVTGWAISTGLRAEYKLETDYLDIIPHAGFRYINLNTDSYDIKSNGTVIDGDSFTQNVWTFPFGVSLGKSIELENGWHFKPLADFVVTPATGDIKAKSRIHFSGIGQEAELDTKAMDYITYGGTAGIEFGNETVSIGVNYNGQYGAETSAHGIFGTFRVEF